MSIYSFQSEPELNAPVMVSALAGWVDAAGAGTTAAAHLADGGEIIARFDGDVLFDYRSQRPILDIVDGRMRKAVWPQVTVTHSVVAGRDILVLSGAEPDMAWRRFAAGVADVAARLHVAQLITLGSVPAAVPHTLPAPVMTTASDDALLKDGNRPPEGLLRVPAAAVSMVDMHVAEQGVPTVGFFVQVPHYVTGTYPSGVLALLQRFSHHLELEMPLGSFEEEASVHRHQLDDIVEQQPEAREHIRALESMSVDRVVSGEELASEIERYLRDAAPGDRGPFEGPEEGSDR
ncbi:MAG: PAC2 family protein [Actinomycetota bacterium]